MRFPLVVACLGVLLFAPAGRAEPTTSPIIVELLAGKANEVRIGEAVYSREGATAWLGEKAKEFGRHDPVVIACASSTQAGVMAFWLKWAKESHDRVYVAILFPDGEGSQVTLLAPATDPAAAGLQERLLEIYGSWKAGEVPKSLPTPYGDPSPSSSWEGQRTRAEKAAQGVVPERQGRVLGDLVFRLWLFFQRLEFDGLESFEGNGERVFQKLGFLVRSSRFFHGAVADPE